MYSPQQKAQWQNNRRLDTSAVIARLDPDVKPHAYIVGSWVWISFSHKPSSDVLNELKGLGFNWNKKRKVWQHPCGLFRLKPRKARNNGAFPNQIGGCHAKPIFNPMV